MSASDKTATTLDGLVIGIFGPTASGKSSVAEAIAERVPATIISVDSMQVYRGVGVLTNQPTYPTRLVGIWPLAHEGSVGEFATCAHSEVDTALEADASRSWLAAPDSISGPRSPTWISRPSRPKDHAPVGRVSTTVAVPPSPTLS